MHTALSYVSIGIIINNSICLSIDVDNEGYAKLFIGCNKYPYVWQGNI